MRICCAISGFSSMFSLAMRTAPLLARTTFSRIGPNCLQGPHHGAQKSTMTGCSNEASTTSAMKLAVVTSLMGGAPAPGAPPSPPPIKVSFVMPRVLPEMPRQNGGDGAPRQAPPRYGSFRRTAELQDYRGVAAGGNEAQQVGGRDGGGSVIFERVIVERVAFKHAAVEHHPDAMLTVVGERERG